MRKLIKLVLSGIVASFAVFGLWMAFINIAFPLAYQRGYLNHVSDAATSIFLMLMLLSWIGAMFVTYKWLLHGLKG